MTAPLRIVIADDHLVVRRGLRALLDTEPGLLVVGEAANGLEAVAAVRTLTPDVVVLDLEMPQMDGITAIGAILAERPGTAILVLTSFSTDDKVLPAIRAGALGYLLKDTGPEELIGAIHQIGRGEPALPPNIARTVMRELTRRPAHATPRPTVPASSSLTPRELTVLQQIARGASNAEIAADLSLSEATVRTHVSSILNKLRLTSRTQAALYALRNGLATIEK
jgi:NarL family two-component system response regulator LiaR